MPTQRPSDPLFEFLSRGRRGPRERVRVSAGLLSAISRTVNRIPEVMIKVLPRGANDLKAVKNHLAYIARKGELDLETEEGETLRGARAVRDLIEDWDLELDGLRGPSGLPARSGSTSARLVHKLIFSMPAGTPPAKVLSAVLNFCREEFALKHRYALALHTDEPHPHVHVVLKALSEEGQRLHIRKATLREWRTEFARHLREVGVPANATLRAARGETRSRPPDGIYRTALRGESSHLRERTEAVARELARGSLQAEGATKTRVLHTREALRHTWLELGKILAEEGHAELAGTVERYIKGMSPPLTDKEHLAAALLERSRSHEIKTMNREPPRAR